MSDIKKYLPENINTYTYFEPFVGGGAVLFELRPQKAVINDFNSQLMLTYAVIKENVEELIDVLKEYGGKNSEKNFYEIRNLDRDKETFDRLTKVEKAARLIYLNKTCFNGLYRVNSLGFFNVPYGKYRNPAICEEITLRRISNYFNSNEIEILNGDFEQAVAAADKQSFIYFDPPYHSPDNTGFTGYHADGFGEKEQERLRDVMITMTRRGVKCLLSNSDTDYIRGLYNCQLFDIISVRAKRIINSDSAGRGNVNELLVLNWKAGPDSL